MEIDYTELPELIEATTPGPWKAVDEYTDGRPRPDTSRTMYSADGKYLGIMHGADAEITAMAPDIARDMVVMRDGVATIRDRCSTLARSAQEAGMTALANEMFINAKALTGLLGGSAK